MNITNTEPSTETMESIDTIEAPEKRSLEDTPPDTFIDPSENITTKHGNAEASRAEDETIEDEAVEDATAEDAPEARLDYLSSAMEALLFMHDKPVTVAKLRSLIDPSLPMKHYRLAMERLRQNYRQELRGLEIIELAHGLQIRTKPHMAPVLRKLVQTTPLKLTNAMMEVLSVVAYKQPVTKDEIDQIRGVDCGYLLRTLMDKKLIRITGRSELPGRPILYGITHEFLELFNLKDVSCLPPLHEIEAMVAHSEVGEENAEAAQLAEFGRMVDASLQGQVLFDDSKLDEELDAIRTVINEVSTSTEYLDYQRALERHQAQSQALRDEGKTEQEILELLGPEPVAPWHRDSTSGPSPELVAEAQQAEESRHEELIVKAEVALANEAASLSQETSHAQGTAPLEPLPEAPRPEAKDENPFELPQ